MDMGWKRGIYGMAGLSMLCEVEIKVGMNRHEFQVV